MNYPTPTPNVPLLRKMVEWVEEQAALPSKKRSWHQGVWTAIKGHRDFKKSWSCDTAMCLAGKVAMDDGWLPDLNLFGDGWVEKDGVRQPVWWVADKLLGLDDGHELYDGENNAADIRRIAEHIAGERL